MSSLLHFSEHRLQELALGIHGHRVLPPHRLVPAIPARPGTPGEDRPGGHYADERIVYSWAIIAMPWAMESTRKRFLLYVQFVVFHLGVAAAILCRSLFPTRRGCWKPFGDPGIPGDHGRGLCGGTGSHGAADRQPVHAGDQLAGRLLFLGPADRLAVLGGPGGAQRRFAGAKALLAFFLLTAFFLVYVPVQQDFALPVLSLYAVLLRKEHGVPGGLSVAARADGRAKADASTVHKP